MPRSAIGCPSLIVRRRQAGPSGANWSDRYNYRVELGMEGAPVGGKGGVRMSRRREPANGDGVSAGPPANTGTAAPPAGLGALAAHAARTTGAAAAWLFLGRRLAASFPVRGSSTRPGDAGDLAPPGAASDVAALLATAAGDTGHRPVLRASLPRANSWRADGGTLVATRIGARKGSGEDLIAVHRGALVLGWPTGMAPTPLAIGMMAPLVALLDAACRRTDGTELPSDAPDALNGRGRAELHRDRAALADTAAIERRLDDALTTAEALADIVAVCSELTGKDALLVDGKGTVLAAHHRAKTPHAPWRGAADEMAVVAGILAQPSRHTGRAVMVPADPASGRFCRYLAAPVSAAGERHGWLLLAEHPSPLTASDERLAHRAADYLGVEFRVRSGVVRTSARDRAELARRLIRGTADPDEVRRAGRALGVDIAGRRLVVHVDGAATVPAGEGDDALAASAARHLGTEVLATGVAPAVTLLVSVPSHPASVTAVTWVKAGIDALVRERWAGMDLAIGISSLCDAGDLPRGYREARKVARMAKPSGGCLGPGVLAADDLGPARLFLNGDSRGAGRRYAGDVLGKLLSQRPGMPDLLLTLRVFLACGHKVGSTAKALGVHENTVRLRLDRIHQATGLDVVRDPRDQLTAQTAVLLHDLSSAMDR